MAKKIVIHKAKSKRYKKKQWPQKHTVGWKDFIKLKHKKTKNFPEALKEASKDWPKAKNMSLEEARKNFGSIGTPLSLPKLKPR